MARRSTSTRRGRGPSALVWLVALLLAVALHLLSTTARAKTSPDAARLERDNRNLKLLIELASEKSFYLVLDSEKPALKLLYEGVTVRDVPIGHVSVGRPRILFFPRPLPHDWRDTVWERGTLVPLRVIPRRTIVPPNPDSILAVSEEVEIPPTPEELVPAPDRWSIRYDDGRVLEIVGRGAKRSFKTRLADGARALGRALWPLGGDRVRLRLVLAAEDAGALYRAIPDTTRFKLM